MSSEIPLSTKIKAAEIAKDIIVAFLGVGERNLMSDSAAVSYAKNIATVYEAVHKAALKSITD